MLEGPLVPSWNGIEGEPGRTSRNLTRASPAVTHWTSTAHRLSETTPWKTIFAGSPGSEADPPTRSVKRAAGDVEAGGVGA